MNGIDLSAQRLPEGEGYVYVRAAAAAVAGVRRGAVVWTDLGKRRQALQIADQLEHDISWGQKDLFFLVGNYPREMRAVAAWVGEELQRHDALLAD